MSCQSIHSPAASDKVRDNKATVIPAEAGIQTPACAGVTPKRGQCGNALFLILIAVALFAALSYAITQSGRGGGSIDKEKAVLDASTSRFCNAYVQQAVDRLEVVGGCAGAEISYELSDGTNANPDAPVDKHCHVFDAAGAGATPCGAYLVSSDTSCDLEALAAGEKCSDSDIVYVSDTLGSRLYTTVADQAGLYNGDDAITACTALGDGWHLPTKDELNQLYQARNTGSLDGTFNETGAWTAGIYWSATPDTAFDSWYQWFPPSGPNAGFQSSGTKSYEFSVRCVKS